MTAPYGTARRASSPARVTTAVVWRPIRSAARASRVTFMIPSWPDSSTFAVWSFSSILSGLQLHTSKAVPSIATMAHRETCMTILLELRWFRDSDGDSQVRIVDGVGHGVGAEARIEGRDDAQRVQ